MNYPLYFRENRHPKIWGEESWEISAHPSSPSVVANGTLAGRALTDVVRDYRSYLPERFPLVHPSPRNQIWMKKNPWFEEDVVPELRRRVADALS